MQMQATHLRDNRWAVRPAGALGTCGWIGGVPWIVVYVLAHTAEEAVRKAGTRGYPDRAASKLH